MFSVEAWTGGSLAVRVLGNWVLSKIESGRQIYMGRLESYSKKKELKRVISRIVGQKADFLKIECSKCLFELNSKFEPDRHFRPELAGADAAAWRR